MIRANADDDNLSLSSILLTDMKKNEAVGVSFLPSTIMDIENFPIEQILLSDWFQRNITQILNISVTNLTTLLNNAQNTQTQGFPTKLPLSFLATLTFFYATILIAGILGNLITCIVISRNNFMHTATNYYLFNLAVSDLILLLSGMPQDMYNLWHPYSYPFTDLFCISESVLSETAANATVLTITAFTVERYIAICHPFRQHTMSKLSRAIKFIFAIWMTAFLLALPQAMQFSVVPQAGGRSCTMQNDFYAHVFAVSGFIFFVGPMTVICVLYVLIGIKLKQSRMLQALPRRCYSDIHRGISAQSRVIRMLVAVAVAFFLCWAPFHAQRLMAVYGSTADIKSDTFNDIFYILDYTSGVLYFLSTCINPLLYNIMSHKFREAFKVTLVRQFGFKNRHQSQSHTYSALLRQNNSMRLHTMDSMRTTTTTTTINSQTGGSGSCHSSRRNHYVSVGPQNSLVAQSNKNDLHEADVRSSHGHSNAFAYNAQLHTRRPQISRISSVDNATLFEETKIDNFCPLYSTTGTKNLKQLKSESTASMEQIHTKQCPNLNTICLTKHGRPNHFRSTNDSTI